MDYYTSSGKRFIFSYQELKSDYHRFKEMSDEEFVASAADILHFCCMVSCLKELSSEAVLEDDAIIHELVHFLVPDTKDEAIDRLEDIRDTFNKIMEIA